MVPAASREALPDSMVVLTAEGRLFPRVLRDCIYDLWRLSGSSYSTAERSLSGDPPALRSRFVPVRSIVAAGLLASLLLSTRLWLSSRTYPQAPLCSRFTGGWVGKAAPLTAAPTTFSSAQSEVDPY
jgi:hypothetical protein